jgi:hypothetical protein
MRAAQPLPEPLARPSNSAKTIASSAPASSVNGWQTAPWPDAADRARAAATTWPRGLLYWFDPTSLGTDELVVIGLLIIGLI